MPPHLVRGTTCSFLHTRPGQSAGDLRYLRLSSTAMRSARPLGTPSLCRTSFMAHPIPPQPPSHSKTSRRSGDSAPGAPDRAAPGAPAPRPAAPSHRPIPREVTDIKGVLAECRVVVHGLGMVHTLAPSSLRPRPSRSLFSLRLAAVAGAAHDALPRALRCPPGCWRPRR